MRTRLKFTDLARVEAEPENTEINAAQVQYLVSNNIIKKLYYQCGDELIEQVRPWINDIEAAKNGTVFYLDNSTYNSLPADFHALADPKPSMLANFVETTDWKAKCSELEKQLQEATELSESKDKRIKELEYYTSISDDYVKALEGKLNALEMLKAAEFNLAKAHNEYYPY